jgi:hypothetical protein
MAKGDGTTTTIDSTTDKPKAATDTPANPDAIAKAGAALAQPDSKIPQNAANTSAIDGVSPPSINDSTQAKADSPGIVGKAVKYIKDFFTGGGSSGDSQPIERQYLDDALLTKWAGDSSNDRTMRAYLAGRDETTAETLKKLSKDDDATVRAAVAANPKTPEKVLSSMSGDKEDSVLRALLANPATAQSSKDRIVSKMTAGFGDVEKAKSAAKDPSTPPEVLAKLATLKDRATLHAVADNPSTPVTTLNDLSKDSDAWIKSGVASNPSTPIETLKALRQDKDPMVLDSLAKNRSTPVKDLQSFTTTSSSDYNNPATIRKDKAVQTMVLLADDPTTSPDKLTELASGGGPSVLDAVAKNPKTPAEALDTIVNTTNKSSTYIYNDKLGVGIRESVAQNENTSLKTLMHLSSDRGYTVREDALKRLSKIAEDPSVTSDTLNQLGESKDSRVLEIVAKSKNAPPELLTKISDTFMNVRAAVAENPSTPPELIAKLSIDPDLRPRMGVAKNPAATPEQRALLADDPEMNVRLALAGNQVTEPATLAKLATDYHDVVKGAVAANPSTSPETLATLAEDKAKSVRDDVLANPSTPEATRDKIVQAEAEITRQTGLAQDKSTSPAELAELAKSGDWRVRDAVAQNSSTPPETLSTLASDERSEVRLKVANNESTPAEALTSIAEEKTTDSAQLNLKRAALKNPSIPAETLEKIYNDSVKNGTNENYSDVIAGNPSTPPKVLAQLASDNVYARKKVAGNEHTPPEILAILANDGSADVKEAVAGNEKTPPATLKKMLNYDAPEALRLKLVSNPSMPPAVLDAATLIDRKDIQEIKQAVASNPGASHDTLIRLAAEDPDPNIRLAAAKNLAKGAADAKADAAAATKAPAPAPDSELKAAEREAADAGGDLSQLGITVTDQTGQKAETFDRIQQRMMDKVDAMFSAHQIEENAHDPDKLRTALGLTDDEVKALKPAERVRLADELKGKLAAYGIIADDVLPNIVAYVFHTAGG